LIAKSEEQRLRRKAVLGPTDSSGEIDLAALMRLAVASSETAERDVQATIAELEAQTRRYETAINSISPGICFFDGDGRLILCNRRYAEIYRLEPEQVRPGATLREIMQARSAAGTAAMAVDDYVALVTASGNSNSPSNWTVELEDGRTIKIHDQPMPDGGWVATHEDITAFELTRAAANERLSLQALIDWVPDNLWVKDVVCRFVISNNATAIQIGLSGSEDLIGKTDLDVHPLEAARQYFADEQNIIQSGQPMIDKEEYIIDPSGDRRYLLSTKVPVRNSANEVVGLVGISRDITERRKADLLRDGQAKILEMIALSEPLEEVLEHLMHLVESQLKGIFGSVLLLEDDGTRLRHGAAPSIADAFIKGIDGMCVGPKAGSCGTAAYRREAVNVSDIMHDPLWEDCRELAAANGFRSCWSTPILSYRGDVLGTFAMYSNDVREGTEAEAHLVDVTTRIAGIAIERKLAEERIHFMANHDSLTGLPNRTLLKDRLSQAILYAQRYGRGVSVVFIDLDNFKFVNDSLGHNAGDELLTIIAERMVDSVRAADTVVRLGGDEFVILILDQPNSDIVCETVEKLKTVIAETVQVKGHDFKVTASIGVATYPNDGTDADSLLANADAAMYRAKETGRDNFQFYTQSLNKEANEKFQLQTDLRLAIGRSEFILLYQPQVELRTGRVFAVEALIRWNHPTLGVIPPIKFIPLAEACGLIVPIGDWVLHEACRQNKAWQDAGLPSVNISVNISARQFREKDLVSRVVRALQISGLDGQFLELELTESLIMQDVASAVATMKELQGLGVQLSIDDFGTGYSSLSSLKTFPVARLKIDKSFINDLGTNENANAVASAVISLGHKLNLKVIAEGVETDEQVAFLRDNNCDEMQGNHFSRPLAPGDIGDVLEAPRRLSQVAR
jgi:diguanylate cyclase (GGDEF)-like protein/PAS domain S-box-containing protein